REHLATLLTRQARRDQRTATDRRFDDDRAGREATDDAVAARKVFGARADAGRELRHECAARLDLASELPVAPRVDFIEPGRADGDRIAVDRQRAAMCGGVDAERKTADDGESGLGEVSGESFR